ncbi:hypothetical protein K461DRAFT_296029 [Myriangium duriaei CBS 260.36]|uniref:Protein BNI4 n=1 Tax=Myriangium duriaei CBS 260.36 TaxID=1168546 RepID=A0A9P4J001_9PEZI|nr:hypothetical protein K461DRAFT_296029 [Myriangium duriaei CBS 260.36]
MRPPLQSIQNSRFTNSNTEPSVPSPNSSPSPKRRRQMAEVMQPLVQSNSMSMLQSRSNTADAQSYQHSQRQSQTQRGSFSPSHNASVGQYRATATAPVQPYAFQATPHLRQEHRTSSAPGVQVNRSAGTSTGSASDKSTVSSSPASSISAPKDAKDDATGRPHSIISLSSSIPDLSLHNFDTTPKASPERYRRSSSRNVGSSPISALPPPSAAPSGSGMSSVEHLYIPPPTPRVINRTASDDTNIAKSSEAAKRYRRRSSMAGPDAAGQSTGPSPQTTQRPGSSHGPDTNNTIRPISSHSRHGSAESTKAASIGSSHDADVSRSRQAPPSPVRNSRKDTSPVRVSTENHKRVTTPSPLSRSAFSSENNEAAAAQTSPTKHQSPAAQQLAALSDKDLNKGMKSRLRRAFSFGSAAELRKASAGRAAGENAAPAVSRQPGAVTAEGELDDEQKEIVRRQEAAGIGAGIYSGQGGFSGSTDNLSISSTASSASVMLRKMGKGMKKGGRSLKGLFRPKSVIGVPAADGPIQPSLAEVSMVTVEAERQRVNVNATVSDQSDGGTGFPKLGRNSMEASLPSLDTRPTSSERNDSLRKSIVGSDKERAEVLAAVKKGILKRAGTSSPQASPVIRAQNGPITDAPVNASPAGSAPGTPKDERKSRSLSSTNSSSDYFSQRLTLATRSMPPTPSSSRNISFSPRIQFHDVWSSTEYDRRGEIATCNRLTPMLAQQIKEELNTFKMEMEVHELSKPHTHFF